MNRFAPLLLSLSLLTAAGCSSAPEIGTNQSNESNARNTNFQTNPDLSEIEKSPEKLASKTDYINAVEPGINSVVAPESPINQLEYQVDQLEYQVDQLQDQVKGLNQKIDPATSGLFNIPFPLLMAAGSGLIGLIGLVLSIKAILRLEAQKAHVKDLGRRNKKLVNQIGGLEVQMEQERIMNKRRVAQVERAPTQIRPIPAPPMPTQAMQPAEPTTTSPHETPEPAPQALISKPGLIRALNSDDRQQLREAATSELNITSDSENSIATGRSANTELEVVAGGGSYLLIMLHGQAWLFPTQKTLKGFAAVQPSKGIFDYEQQTIANPQLLEPALLEELGNKWLVKKIGKIGIP